MIGVSGALQVRVKSSGGIDSRRRQSTADSKRQLNFQVGPLTYMNVLKQTLSEAIMGTFTLSERKLELLSVLHVCRLVMIDWKCETRECHVYEAVLHLLWKRMSILDVCFRGF